MHNKKKMMRYLQSDICIQAVVLSYWSCHQIVELCWQQCTYNLFYINLHAIFISLLPLRTPYMASRGWNWTLTIRHLTNDTTGIFICVHIVLVCVIIFVYSNLRAYLIVDVLAKCRSLSDFNRAYGKNVTLCPTFVNAPANK